MKLNLHVHSTCSDGRATPKDIALLMEENNITFSLTDHDTISGLRECRDNLVNKDLLINGMEYSVNFSDDITLHILCYNFDLDIVEEKVRQLELNKLLILKDVYLNLLSNNYNVRVSNIDRINKTELALSLVDNDYAESELFAKRNIINPLIKDQGNINVVDAFNNIHEANGKVFWAHPYEVLNKIGKFNIDNKMIEDIVKELINYKLDGIEVYYGNYSYEQVSFLKSLCDKYNLLFSTGTDIHFKRDDDKLFCDLDEELCLDIYNRIVK